MPRENRTLLGFNRGLISPLAIARVDLPRVSLSASEMVNWMPRTLGPMGMRVGSQYLSHTNGDLLEKSLPFIFSSTDLAQVRLVNTELQVLINDVAVTRATVTAAITNGNFDANIASWTDASEVGGTFAWLTGGYASLLGTGTNAAIMRQQVAVAQAGTEHALRIVVARGPVTMRIGSTAGDDDYFSEVTLGTGTHSVAFTPTGAFFHVYFFNRRSFPVLIDSVNVEAAGVMELPAPWPEAALPLLRLEQSGDVIYAACRGYQQRKIIRIGGSTSPRSWSIVLYEPENGPFRNLNATPITLAPSGLTGLITLTASKALFKPTNFGSLYRIDSVGQNVTASIAAQNTFTSYIRVAGVDTGRVFTVVISNTFVGTVTLQYSVGAPGAWVDVKSWTAPVAEAYNDSLDNQVIYYRIGIKTGGYGSGTADVSLIYTGGSITGVARVTAYTGPTSVSAVVLSDFGAMTASTDWSEGQWSDRRGWPSSVALHESRLMSGGSDKINASISDEYEDYDDTFEGDAGPISRTIGQGPIETIPWLLSLTRLIVGTLTSSANIAAIKIQGNNPLSGRSSSFDEPLTPTNFTLKTSSPWAVFVDPSLTRLIELAYDTNEYDYKPQDLTDLVPDLNEVGIAGIAVQYKPDLRFWCWRTDGTMAVALRDRLENVICWFELETDGQVEDISVMPGAVEDRVYWNVKRTLNGSTVRYREKLALQSECVNGTVNKIADALVTGANSSASATISGLPYPDGTKLICWADGRDFSPGDGDAQTKYTVSGGAITLGEMVINWVVGLGYRARWQSAKLAFAAAMGSALNVRGRVNKLGLIARNMHPRALRYGPTFDDDELDDMPMSEEHEDLDENTIIEEYDFDKLDFDSDWGTDPRICLQATAPRGVTVLALTPDLTKNG